VEEPDVEAPTGKQDFREREGKRHVLRKNRIEGRRAFGAQRQPRPSRSERYACGHRHGRRATIDSAFCGSASSSATTRPARGMTSTRLAELTADTLVSFEW